jgi:hypothetical protein
MPKPAIIVFGSGNDPTDYLEKVENKDTTATLGTSDTKYPSQKAVKTYVDSAVGGIDLSGLVPYTGATDDVDLGTQDLKATEVNGEIAKFGDSSNYTEFEADGTMQAKGDATCWRDELGDVTKLKVQGVGIKDNATEGTITFQTSANLSDFVYTNVQLNHDREMTCTIYPHLHFFQSEDTMPNFLLEYRWQVNGAIKKTDWTQVRCNTSTFSYVAGETIHQIAHTEDGISVPDGTEVSDIVQFKIYRDNANTSERFNDSDPFTTDVEVMSFDVHICTDMLGSRTEYSK